MKVTKLTGSAHIAERYYLETESGESLKINLAMIADFSLFTGRELTEEEWEELQKASDRYLAREKALRSAGSRAMSRKELEKKLEQKGVDAESASGAVEWMESIGAINDAEYAGMIVRHYAASGYGMGRIREELYRRGVPKELWEEALGQLPEPDDTLDRLVSTRLRGECNPKKIKKLTDMLLRRGFGWEEIKSALRRYGTELENDEEC